MIRYEFCCPDCKKTISLILYAYTTVTRCKCGYLHIMRSACDADDISADSLATPEYAGLPLWNADGLRK